MRFAVQRERDIRKKILKVVLFYTECKLTMLHWPKVKNDIEF